MLDEVELVNIIRDWEIIEFGHYQCDCVPATPEQMLRLAKLILAANNKNG